MIEIDRSSAGRRPVALTELFDSHYWWEVQSVLLRNRYEADPGPKLIWFERPVSSLITFKFEPIKLESIHKGWGIINSNAKLLVYQRRTRLRFATVITLERPKL